MSLRRSEKNGNNVPHFSFFFVIKNTIRTSYRYKQVKVPNLFILEVKVLLYLTVNALYPYMIRLC